VDLHYSFSAGHGVVVHVGIEKSKAPSRERFHLVVIKVIAHPDFERPGNDSDVFPLRVPEEPLIVSLQGVFYASTGKEEKALDCLTTACASPKSFGHAHHSYYQIACILALLGRREGAFEWLERSVSNGFACWPFFLNDPYLKNLRDLSGFEVLVSSLQAKYADHLGLL
jgi:hypothetical protein